MTHLGPHQDCAQFQVVKRSVTTHTVVLSTSDIRNTVHICPLFGDQRNSETQTLGFVYRAMWRRRSLRSAPLDPWDGDICPTVKQNQLIGPFRVCSLAQCDGLVPPPSIMDIVVDGAKRSTYRAKCNKCGTNYGHCF